MNPSTLHCLGRWILAAVWLINGLFCKVLNLVPRHQEIVARILGEMYARPITVCIGLGELLLAIWIASGVRSKLAAVVQISLVFTMNLIEYILAPDLLLWGKFNALFAAIFVIMVYLLEFRLKPKTIIRA